MLQNAFFRRLFFPLLGLIALLFASATLLGALRLRQVYSEHRLALLQDEMALVWALLRPEAEAGDPARLQAAVRALRPQVEARVTVIAATAEGAVLADSWEDPSRMGPHGGRPEVAAALRGEGLAFGERVSGTVGRQLLYCARLVRDSAGSPYVIRLSAPTAVLSHELRSLYAAFAVAAVAAIAGAALIVYLFVRRQSAPFERLRDAAQALSRGQLRARADLGDPGADVAGLSSAFNDLAETVEGRLVQADREAADHRVILASIAQGVVATDRQQRITVANAAAGTLLGFDAAAAAGRPLWQALPIEQVVRNANEALAAGEARSFELAGVGGRHLDVTITPYGPAGEPPGLLLVAHDTTESVRYQELRKEFVANVSHELRTPLTVIKGFVETLRDGALQDPVRGPEYLARVERHAAQLTNLVNDLLELSRLEGQGELPRRVNADVAAAARKAVDLLLPAAGAKRQGLSFAAETGLPPVLGNPDYLERAVSNLVDNAVKYTPEGGHIHVAVRGARAAGGAAAVTVEVSDDGIGIPADDLPRIFERFYRVDRSRSREMGGTGLGLSIVKHIVQAHGGALDVRSAPGKGSTFSFRLPAAAAAPAAAPA